MLRTKNRIMAIVMMCIYLVTSSKCFLIAGLAADKTKQINDWQIIVSNFDIKDQSGQEKNIENGLYHGESVKVSVEWSLDTQEHGVKTGDTFRVPFLRKGDLGFTYEESEYRPLITGGTEIGKWRIEPGDGTEGGSINGYFTEDAAGSLTGTMETELNICALYADGESEQIADIKIGDYSKSVKYYPNVVPEQSEDQSVSEAESETASETETAELQTEGEAASVSTIQEQQETIENEPDKTEKVRSGIPRSSEHWDVTVEDFRIFNQNGEQKSETVGSDHYELVAIEVDWKIDIGEGGISVGDTFEIPFVKVGYLGFQYFESAVGTLNLAGQEIGIWEMISYGYGHRGKIVGTFTAPIDTNVVRGTMNTGLNIRVDYANGESSRIVEVEVGSCKKDFLYNEVVLVPVSDITYHKSAANTSNQKIEWRLTAGTNLIRALAEMSKNGYNGTFSEKLDDLIIEDYFPPGVTVEDVSVDGVVLSPLTSETHDQYSGGIYGPTPSTNPIAYLSLMNLMSRIEQGVGESYDAFKAGMAPREWGIYYFSDGGSKVCINLGNVPGNGFTYQEYLSSIGATGTIGEWIQEQNESEVVSDGRKANIDRIYGQGNPVGGAILVYNTLIVADYGVPVSEDTFVTNIGEFHFDNGSGPADYSSEAEGKLSGLEGSGAAGEPGSINLIKVDGENSGRYLPGARFNLLEYDQGSGSWVVKEERITGSRGTIMFSALEPGRYKFEELTPPYGYLLTNNAADYNYGSGYGSAEQYVEIKEEDIAGKVVRVKNTLDPTMSILDVSKNVNDSEYGNDNGVAEAGERLSYSIRISNSGGGTEQNLSVRDPLTDIRQYFTGLENEPVEVWINNVRQLVSYRVSDLIAGITVDVNSKTTVEFRFSAELKPKEELEALHFDQLIYLVNKAIVGNEEVEAKIAAGPGLTAEKTVKNITAPNSQTLKPGDVFEYNITAGNPRDRDVRVCIYDSLVGFWDAIVSPWENHPSGVNDQIAVTFYDQDGNTVSTTTRYIGQLWDSEESGRIYEIIPAGGKITLTFRLRLRDKIDSDYIQYYLQETMSNTVHVYDDDRNEATDKAEIGVKYTRIKAAKTVAEAGINDNGNNVAEAGERIQYVITVWNEGTVADNNVTIRDPMSGIIDYFINPQSEAVEVWVDNVQVPTTYTVAQLISGIQLGVEINKTVEIKFCVTLKSKSDLDQLNFDAVNVIANKAFIDDVEASAEISTKDELEVKKEVKKVNPDGTVSADQTVRPGDIIAYEVTVTNKTNRDYMGPTYEGIPVDDPFSNFKEFIDYQKSVDSGFDTEIIEGNGKVNSWTLQAIYQNYVKLWLSPNETQKIRFKFYLKETLGPGAFNLDKLRNQLNNELTNTITVDGIYQASASIDAGAPDIRVQKSVQDETGNNIASPNEKLYYTITVKNEGTLPESVTIQDTLAEMLPFVHDPSSRTLVIQNMHDDNVQNKEVSYLQSGFEILLNAGEGVEITFSVIMKNGAELEDDGDLKNTVFVNDKSAIAIIKMSDREIPVTGVGIDLRGISFLFGLGVIGISGVGLYKKRRRSSHL